MKWTIELEHQYISHFKADVEYQVNPNKDKSIIVETLSVFSRLCFFYFLLHILLWGAMDLYVYLFVYFSQAVQQNSSQIP